MKIADFHRETVKNTFLTVSVETTVFNSRLSLSKNYPDAPDSCIIRERGRCHGTMGKGPKAQEKDRREETGTRSQARIEIPPAV